MIKIPKFSDTVSYKRLFLENLSLDISTLSDDKLAEIKQIVFQCWAHSKTERSEKRAFRTHKSPIVSRYFFSNKINFKNYIKLLFEILIEEYGISHDEIPNKISHVFLIKNGFRNVLDQGYRVYEIVEIGLGNKNTFYPWSFKGHHIWIGPNSDALAKKAVKWMVEEKLGIQDIKSIPNHINLQTLKKYGLFGLYARKFNCNIGKMILFAYPNQFKPYEFITDWRKNPDLLNMLIYDFMKKKVTDISNYYQIGSYIYSLKNQTKLSKYLLANPDESLLTVVDRVFPGFESFYIQKMKKYSKDDAKRAIKALGIKTYKDYSLKYKQDPKLPSNPIKYYQSKWSELSF